MKLGKDGGSKPKFDFSRVADDFRNMDAQDPGSWALAPKIVILIGILILTVGIFAWVDWRSQWQTLESARGEELKLKEDWRDKKRQAVNLPLLQEHLEKIDQQFGTLLKQLPNKAEMDALLQDVNQAGLKRGLRFELFKPGNEILKDFYAEMPVNIKIVGSYQEIGEFAEDTAKMSRIVVLNNMNIQSRDDGLLSLDGNAVTYRYLDETELSAQRKQGSAADRRRR